MVESERQIAPMKEALAAFLQSLWDAGLRPSHAVQTIAYCVAEHDDNRELTISLLDRRMLAGDHRENIVFTPSLRLKDVRYALEYASSLGIGSPFGALAEVVFRQLSALGLQDANESAVLEVARLQMPAQ